MIIASSFPGALGAAMNTAALHPQHCRRRFSNLVDERNGA
jgi:hypothetical protein